MRFSSLATTKKPRPRKAPTSLPSLRSKPVESQHAIQLQRKRIREAYKLQPDHVEPADDWGNAEAWRD